MRAHALLILLALSIATAAFGFTKGENLITPFIPSAEEWDLYGDPEDPATALWKRKSNENDWYAVSVRNRYKPGFVDFRRRLDLPGRTSCDEFESTTLADQPLNGYQRLMWKTRCMKDGAQRSSMLQLIIQGRDSFYHVQKIWRYDVPSTDVDEWISRFSANLVCDTRRKANPCPEGFKRVE